jgi:hypothetical protein
LYLVDTNVLSAGAPTKAVAMPALLAWMHRNSGRLYLSVITVAEVEDGIAKSRRLGAHRKAERLSEWLETLLHLYARGCSRSTRKRRGTSASFRTLRAVRARRPVWRTCNRRHGAEERLYHPDPQSSAAFRPFGSRGARPVRNAAGSGPVSDARVRCSTMPLNARRIFHQTFLRRNSGRTV